MLHLGRLAIDAEPLRTPAATEAATEAMAELGLDGDPPALWLVDMADLRGLAADTNASGVYVHEVERAPLILVQRGLAEHAERASLRHEMAHWAQDQAGRFEVFEGGVRGRWWVSAEATRAADEAQATGFGCDERYWAARRDRDDDAPDMIITLEAP